MARHIQLHSKPAVYCCICGREASTEVEFGGIEQYGNGHKYFAKVLVDVPEG